MKKRYIIAILIVVIIAILTFNFLNGLDYAHCEEYSIKIPEGLEIPHGSYQYQTDKVHTISLTTGLVEAGEHYRNLDLSTVPLENLPNTNNMSIAEDYTEGDLKVVKGQVNDGYYYGGDNVTFAEFDKDGKHFYLVIDSPWDMDLEDINLNDDVKLSKEIKESIKFN